MLGLVLLYFAGKAYFDLAARHEKSKWGFAILGVVSYYAGLFIGGILIAFLYALSTGDEMNELALTVCSIPVGVLTCWGLYKFLEKKWNQPDPKFVSEDVLDSGVHPDNL